MADQTKEHQEAPPAFSPERAKPEAIAPEFGIEQAPQPERALESELQHEQEKVHPDTESRRRIAQPQTKTSQTEPALPYGTPAQQVEAILEENLQEVFRGMSPEQQQRFKQEGEKTAQKVTELLSAVKVKVQAITKVILRWLRFIPGVSQYYLEQEAKIKTDKILRLRHPEKDL